MKFIITGFPRTRSAWFAAYLTSGTTYCYHEATFTDEDLDLPGYENVGSSDSGYLLRPEWASRNMPDKTVIIHRDIDIVEASLKRIGVENTRMLLETMEPALEQLEGLHINFDEINDRIEDVHDYLQIEYDPKRAELFAKMNIQEVNWRH